jgi:hypothetical protein
MELTRSVVERRAEEYRDEEPLYAVEDQHVDILPDMLAEGEFGRRDVEWVVRWHYRRYLGEYPHADRRATEEAFGENSYEDVSRALADVVSTDPEAVGARIDRLTELSGVDVRVASAFLAFLDPERHIVVGDREWTVLHEAGELSEPYPDPPTVADYESYLATCQSVCDRLDVDAWTLHRALWRLWTDLADRTDRTDR